MPSRLGLLGVSGPIGGGVAPPSSFVPTDIYDLEAWYYQPDIDYAAGTWVDRSGNTRNLTQGTAGNRPTLSAALAELNGKYAVVGDGGDDYISTATWTVIPQPFSMLVVARKATSTAEQKVIIAGHATDVRLNYSSNPNAFWLYAGAATPAGPTITTNRFNVLTGLYEGANSFSIANGVSGAKATPGTNGLTGVRLFADSALTAANYLGGDISEAMAYRGKLGAYDLMRLWNEWVAADRYNIPVSFLPTSITGCQLWVRGDDLSAVDSAISSWADQSGNGRNITQGTGGSQPLVKIGRNGKKCAKFDGIDDYLTSAGFTLNQPYTVAIVFSQDTWTLNDYIFDTTASGNGRLMQATGTPSVALGAGGANDPIVAGPVLGTFGIVIGQFDGASSFLTLDGGTPDTGNPGAGNGTKFVLGANGVPGGYGDIRVAEVIVYNTSVTTAQRQQLEGYLANKYAINAAIRPFDPLAVAGCKGWWRVDGGCDVSADGSAIGVLYDKSGNGNHLIQATATNKPSYEIAELNGLAVARFDGIDNWLKTVAFTLVQPETVILVVKQNTWTNTEGVFDGNTVGSMLLYQESATPRLDMYAGTSVIVSSSAIQLGQYDIITLIFNGASSKSFIDSITAGSGNAGAAGAGGFTLGARADGTTPSNVDVAEVILYSAELSIADRQSIEAYLCKFYDIGYKAPNHSSLLANLQLWLDASQETGVVDGASMPTVTDFSGNGRNFSQATGSLQPTIQTLEVNGRPTVRYDPSNDYVEIADGAWMHGAAFTYFIITKPVTSALFGSYLNRSDGVDNSFSIQRQHNGDGLLFLASTSGADGSTYQESGDQNLAGAHRIIAYVYNGAGAANADKLKLYINGALMVGGVSFTGTFPASLRDSALTLRIGSNRSGGSPALDADMYGVVIFNSVLSNADLRAVTNYLAQQLNIAV